LKIALSQINCTIGAFKANLERILSAYEEGARKGADIVVFPELALSGYPPQDLLERKEFLHAQDKAFNKILAFTKETGLILGHISRNPAPIGKQLMSSVSLLSAGKVLHTAHKRLLPTYDIFNETRYFEPGQSSVPVTFKGIRLGLTICEDIWTDQELCHECRYNIDPVEELVDQGIDVLINVSASPFHLGKLDLRLSLAKSITTKAGVPLLYCNAVGGQDCLVFDGNSLAVDKDGGLMAHLSAFKEDLGIVDLDNGRGEIRDIPETLPAQAVLALRLALKDYMNRCGFKRAVIGLSGGIDSSVTAAIAASTIGPEKVLGVIMPSRFTSKESVEDAIELSRNLGIRYEIIPIEEVFSAYLGSLAPVFKDTTQDVTEENLQARVRGNILMAISNKFGHLVLSTGNKSELAVGYCTLYGDLSGGFSLISDCPKTLVYEMARYINKKKEVIPERVLKKAPSAELRPDQKDEDDLPPYPVLDKVLKAYIEENKTIDEIIERGIPRATVERVVGMVIKNEYKRRQAPIGPRISRKALCCGRLWPVCHGFKT